MYLSTCPATPRHRDPQIQKRQAARGADAGRLRFLPPALPWRGGHELTFQGPDRKVWSKSEQKWPMTEACEDAKITRLVPHSAPHLGIARGDDRRPAGPSPSMSAHVRTSATPTPAWWRSITGTWRRATSPTPSVPALHGLAGLRQARSCLCTSERIHL
jgi:hypothetical protein